MLSISTSNRYFLIIPFVIGMILNSCPQKGRAQIKISGPVCAVQHITYLYRIEGNEETIKAMTICVTGGSIPGLSSDCYTGKPVSFIKIRWDQSTKTGSISLASSGVVVGLAFNVEIADSLNPGIIDSSDSMQQINYNTVPDSINCTEASGGSCSPVYHYQWQVSSDATHWSNIIGGTGRNMIFFTPLKSPSFYRRKVIEIKSGSVSYSSMAAVYVKPGEPS